MRKSLNIFIIFCAVVLLFAACAAGGEPTVKIYKNVD